LRLAHASRALRSKDLARVTVDIMVQPKNITFPTDAKLSDAAIKGLNRLATSTACGCGNPTSASPGARR
jgi:IS5 family transposase